MPVSIPSRLPSTTINAAGIAGAASTLLIWGWNGFMPEQPPLDAVQGAGITTGLMYLIGWMRKETRYPS